jgi:PAS domain S-box-containing protein
MKKNRDQPADAGKLRRRAEQQLSGKRKRQRSEVGDQRTAGDDTARLVHELQVHKLKLEMQNDELKTSRANVEAGLALYADLYDFAPACYFTFDRDGSIRLVNLSGVRLLGVDRSRLVKRRFGQFVAEGDRRAFSDFLQKVFEGRGKEYCEVTLQQVGSQSLVVQIEATRSADGQECRAVVLDITERKRAEASLRDAEIRYRLLFDQSPDGIVIIDPETACFLEFNETACRQLGYSREEFARLSIFDIEQAETHEDTKKHIAKVMREGRNDFETLHCTRQGEIRNIHVTAQITVVLGRQVYHCVWRDITVRKRSEEALKDYGEELSAIYENAPFIMMLVDEERRVHKVNRYGLDFAGSKLDEVVGLRAGDALRCLHSLDVPGGCGLGLVCGQCVVRQAVYDTIETGINKQNIEASITFGHNGIDKEVPFLLSATAVTINKNQMVLVSLVDITLLKQAELKLKESNDKIAQILNSTAEGIYGLDLSGICTFCNPACVKILGYRDEHEIVGQNMHNLIHHTKADGTPYPEEECSVYKSLRTGKNYHIERELFWRADGSSFPVEYWAYPIRKNTIVQGMVVSLVDRSEQVALHDQLRQAQKMEAIGTLTGGIAHDFNNILSAIIGYGYVTLMKMPQDDPLRLNIEHILESADRAAALIKSLLAFSRKQVLDRKPVDLNTVLKNLEKFLVRVIGEDVKVCMAFGDIETAIFADAGQLEQVFMNLATNARDAMPQGGSFTIETAITELDNRYVTAHGYGKPGSYAMITVSDTGIGMNDETRMKIFDPFFTTKETGKGTGLGLAMVYGIIKQHEGLINVYSEPGIGTTFRIYLPLSREAVVDEYRPTVSEDPMGGTETILLAEDDANVRKITVDVLEQMGYTVISANDGEEAVKKYLELKDKIRLLLFDLIMPKKNGKEAYDEIKNITPDIKCIFLTGYAADIIQQKGLLQDTVVMLNKPISPMDLLKKVRSVLN